jgi:hypothetical protein
MTKYYTKCESCRDKIGNQRYNELPFQEWDGVTPIVRYDDDVFFFDIDDLV